MEWEKAKNIILLFFILLNLVLAGFIFMENQRYTVSGEQESTIRAVLAQHNISMYTDIIRRFPPMRSLRIAGYYYDEETFLTIFFDDPSLVERVETRYGVGFSLGTAQLWFFQGGFVSYFNPSGMNGTAEDFIERHFPDFVRDERFNPHDDEGRRVVYRQVYRGHTIYSNNIEFLVTDDGIIEIDMQFGRVYGFDGPDRDIFAPDEALVTFMQRAHVLIGNQPITIWYMDIVYVLEFDNASDERGSIHWAIPFYRIFVHGHELPFLINAYTNKSIDG
jgi:hypothetical protein